LQRTTTARAKPLDFKLRDGDGRDGAERDARTPGSWSCVALSKRGKDKRQPTADNRPAPAFLYVLYVLHG